ncbi:hypothetical protein EJB05_37993 [Eragrostis curvula]|uniref:Uncharacterized protein n=1 Tax=Eragrostis curvula TaxID=38414 RepID=A0A5J9TUP0_9POAL|nr:hypothetical protein EJB05_37993 [Eragrostis curvula]
MVELRGLTREEVTTAELLEQVVTEARTTEQTQPCVEPVIDAGSKEETSVLVATHLSSAALEVDGVATSEPSNVAEPSTVQAQACKVHFGTHQLDENMKDRVRMLAKDPHATAVFIAKMNATSIKHSEMYFPAAVSKKLIRRRKVPFHLQMLQQEAHDTTLIASSLCEWRVSRKGKNVLLKEKMWCKIVGIAALGIGDKNAVY